MPKNITVDKMYQAIKKKSMKEGMGKKKAKAKAAKIAQSKTGKSLATGKKAKTSRNKRLESARF